MRLQSERYDTDKRGRAPRLAVARDRGKPTATGGVRFILTLAAVATMVCVLVPTASAGPLTVDPGNPRYFTDGSGQAVYLTGSHTWNSLVELSTQGTFDYDGYLSFLQTRGHNFIRLWTWEHAEVPTSDGVRIELTPAPFQRPGPGTALDGKPKFDVTRLNQGYFDRLRERVIAAGDRGMYVSLMLFEGWSIAGFDNAAGSTATLSAWEGHPFHPSNNVNGIDGDANADGKGYEVHSLQVPAVVAAQEAYVRKVVETVNDLDNVLFEIANESWGASWEWQYRMIDFVKSVESGLPKRHPVGFTVCGNGPGYVNQWISPQILFGSNADWVSPASNSSYGDYKSNPPVATGAKVILVDTDHLWGIGGDRAWVWKSFCRGLNPIYMDNLDDDASMEDARRAMGHTREYADRMDLQAMTPTSDSAAASTGYCLRSPGVEYLVYQPGSGAFTVDVTTGTYRYEWLRPSTGVVESTGEIEATGGSRTFTPPFTGDAVLYLKVQSAAEPVEGRIGDGEVSSHPSFDVAVDEARGRIHFVYSQAHSSATAVYYMNSDDGGETWTAPERMPGNGKEARIGVDSAGVVHMAYATNTRNVFDESEIWYRARRPDGTWTTPVQVQGIPESDGESFVLMGPRIAVDPADNVHITCWKWLNNVATWPDYLHRMRCVYTRLPAGATTLDPVNEFSFAKNQYGGGCHGDLAIDPTTGDLHLIYAGFSRNYHSSAKNGWRLHHLVRHFDGTWDSRVGVYDAGVSDYALSLDVDATGRIHVASFHQRGAYPEDLPKYFAYYNNVRDENVLDLAHYAVDDWSIVVDIEEVDGAVFAARVNVSGQNYEPWRATIMSFDPDTGQWTGPTAVSPAGYRNGGYRHGAAPKFAVYNGHVLSFYAEQAPGAPFRFYQQDLYTIPGSGSDPQNTAPTVAAGPDATVETPNPGTITLAGSASDDGLPSGSSLATAWSVVSGPGAASFADPADTGTAATFPVAGVYELKLTADDGDLQASDTVTITVAPNNTAPTVAAGPDATVETPNPGTITLAGSASDDGLPSGSSLATAWSVVSGPGAVSFADPADTGTAATFPVAGVYELELTADDGDLQASDTVTIAVVPNNEPPQVEAGAPLQVTLHSPGTGVLNGSVYDDGQPEGATLELQWSVVSGPGPVVFGSPNSEQTTATFTVPGAYVLKLTASDSEHEASDTVMVTVVQGNEPPVVEAGASFVITLHSPGTGVLNGEVSDDGLPEGAEIQVEWSVVDGPGPVVFGDPNSLQTTATFTVPGAYTLQLTASDGEHESSDTVVINVVQGNDPPTVDAGPDVTTTLHSPGTVSLTGSADDDGLPTDETLALQWTQVSGPGTVSFTDASAAATTATIPDPGTYVLRLTADDGEFTVTDEMTVTAVRPQAAAPTIVPAGGSFTNEVEVAISTATADATIRYTLDGTAPTAGSPAWDGPVTLDASATVRAIAVAPGYEDSLEATAEFEIVPDTAGSEPTGLLFDGLDDIAEASTVAGAVDAFSVEFWIRPETLKNWNQNICAGGWGQFVFHTTSGGAIYAGTDIATRFTPTQLPAGTVEPGVWQHFAYAFDGRTAYLYKNGELLASKPQTDPQPWTVFRFGLIGSRYALQGGLDEIRLYDRALTATEVATHYGDGQGESGTPEPGLWAGWHLDEGVGVVAHDYSGNGHDAALLNGVAWGEGAVGRETDPIPVEQVVAPEIAPDGCTYTNEVTVTLSTATELAAIYYTVDGTEPGVSGLPYLGPFTLTESTTVRTRAFREGWIPSDETAAVYTIHTEVDPGTELGSALAFDGVDDIVEIPTLTGSLEAFSVEFWICPGRFANWNQNIVADGCWGQFVFHTTSTGAIYCGTDMATRFSPYQLPSGTLAADEWQHFAYTFDNGQARIYRNGALLAAKTQAMPEPWTGFRIGLPVSRYAVDGCIDELRVYRRALAATEVADHYGDGEGIAGEPESGLIAGWHFDEASGDTACDYSGAGHTAYLVNGAGWAEGIVPAAESGGLVTTADPFGYTPGVTPEDADGDGLPDAWEEAMMNAATGSGYRTVMELRPGDDIDRDGLANGAEYAAGTDAFNAGSVFRIRGTGRDRDGRMFVEFTCEAGRTYSIWAIRGESDWQQIDHVTAETAGIFRWVEPASDAARGFYAVSVDD